MSRTLTLGTQGLLISLCPFNDGLDMFFLFAPCFIVAPPMRSLILAVKSKVTACFAFGFPFITLLASQATCEATYPELAHDRRQRQRCWKKPT